MTTEKPSTPWAVHPAALLLGAALLSGCATGPNANPADPLEPYNRSMNSFNENVDKAVLKPVATAYRDVTPQPLRTGVTNFFANLGDAWSFVNNILQAKPEGALHSFWRVVINSTMGLGGVLDVASEAGIDRHKQDFGLTLGHWGVPTGPYLVLPLLGPSTVRDTAALPVDFYVGDLVDQVDDMGVRNSLYGLRIINTRANLLGTTSVIETAALDRYSFTRDAYLQLRSGAKAGAGADDGKLPEDY